MYQLHLLSLGRYFLANNRKDGGGIQCLLPHILRRQGQTWRGSYVAGSTLVARTYSFTSSPPCILIDQEAEYGLAIVNHVFQKDCLLDLLKQSHQRGTKYSNTFTCKSQHRRRHQAKFHWLCCLEILCPPSSCLYPGHHSGRAIMLLDLTPT